MKKPRRILTLATLMLLVGITVAYYNTSSFGYDDANIISINNEEVRIFDVTVNYREIEKKFESVKKNMPSDFITV
jgi:TPP-dependent 2-oxoacid decarboxylase